MELLLNYLRVSDGICTVLDPPVTYDVRILHVRRKSKKKKHTFSRRVLPPGDPRAVGTKGSFRAHAGLGH